MLQPKTSHYRVVPYCQSCLGPFFWSWTLFPVVNSLFTPSTIISKTHQFDSPLSSPGSWSDLCVSTFPLSLSRYSSSVPWLSHFTVVPVLSVGPVYDVPQFLSFLIPLLLIKMVVSWWPLSVFSLSCTCPSFLVRRFVPLGLNEHQSPPRSLLSPVVLCSIIFSIFPYPSSGCEILLEKSRSRTLSMDFTF